MQLLEHQAKAVLKNHGISVPQGRVVTSLADARAAAEAIGRPVMLKAQVLAGRRGKAGGIRPAADPEEASSVFQQLAAVKIRGFPVEEVLVEERLAIQAEYYVGIMVDPKTAKATLILSTSGGMEVEGLSQRNRGTFARCQVNGLYGLMPYQVRGLIARLTIPRQLHKSLVDLCLNLYTAFASSKGTLVEINPLAVVSDGALIAGDARLNADDSAVPFIPFLAEIKRERMAADTLANLFEKNGIQYVPMGGNIGVISTGAGATLSICDAIAASGGRPFGWLDVSPALVAGGFKRPAMVQAIALALHTLDSMKGVEAILINSIAGGLSVQLYAEAVCEVLASQGRPSRPFVVHVGGNGEEAGRTRLSDAGIPYETTLERAIEHVVALSKGGAR